MPVDMALLAKEKGLNVIWALSHPGKTAPVSAGEILADTVLEMLYESGICEERMDGT